MKFTLWVGSVVVAIGKLCVIICLIPLRGWGLNRLWEWYIEPVFNLPAPTVWQCAGLVLAVQMVSPWKKSPKREEGEEWEFVTEVLETALGVVLLVFIGHTFRYFL